MEPFVDEIVIVDGGPQGPSTDGTAEIISAMGDKVVHEKGKFATPSGSWDSGRQRNTGLARATGDVVVFVSADMFFSNMGLLRKAIDESSDEEEVFFCSTLEFWLNMEKLRLYTADSSALAVPAPILQVVAVKSSLAPYFDASGKLCLDDAEAECRLEIPQTFKFHTGWIRPFADQVAKHIGHVEQGLWGENGQKLLNAGRMELERWAITHVLSYRQIFSIDFYGDIPKELAGLDLDYSKGYKAVLERFEANYGDTVFQRHRFDDSP